MGRTDFGQLLMIKFRIEVWFSLGPNAVSSFVSQVTAMMVILFMSGEAQKFRS
jgi:hypothetical protein